MDKSYAEVRVLPHTKFNNKSKISSKSHDKRNGNKLNIKQIMKPLYLGLCLCVVQ